MNARQRDTRAGEATAMAAHALAEAWQPVPLCLRGTGRPWWTDLAAWLPDAAVHHLAWEVSLAPTAAPPDLQLGIRRRAPRVQMVPHAGVPWSGAVGAGLTAWWRGALPASVGAVFLEVDAPRRGVPSVPLWFPSVHASVPVVWQHAQCQALLAGGGQVPSWLPAALTRLHTCLPPCQPRYLATLHPRGVDAVRWIGVVRRERLRALLCAALGHAAGEQAYRVWCDAVPTMVQPPVVQLGLDLTPEGVGPRVGMELYWSSAPGRLDPRLHAVLERLSAWPELCAQRVAAARAWVREGATVAGELQLKVTADRGQRSAKAYLGAWAGQSAGR